MTDKTIVTHNEGFHADDVFSIAVLKQIYPNCKLIRTREETVINAADIVVDVGNQYDPKIGRFDHHQRGGAGARENGIPFSSFGLIWKEYGLTICENDQAIADAVDAELVSEIDAIDCGYVEGSIKGISLSQTIGMFNPTWQEKESFDRSFDEAVTFATRILMRFIASAKSDYHARSIIAAAIEKASDPRLIVLNKYVPWKETVHALSNQALYVIYPSLSGKWMLQTVPVEPNSFEDRKPLPQPWAGLSGSEFQKVTGIEDAVFCHNGLFISGAVSFNSIMKMAEIALNGD